MLLGHQIVIALLNLRLKRLRLTERCASFLTKGADLLLLVPSLAQRDARLGEGLLSFCVFGLSLQTKRLQAHALHHEVGFGLRQRLLHPGLHAAHGVDAGQSRLEVARTTRVEDDLYLGERATGVDGTRHVVHLSVDVVELPFDDDLLLLRDSQRLTGAHGPSFGCLRFFASRASLVQGCSSRLFRCFPSSVDVFEGGDGLLDLFARLGERILGRLDVALDIPLLGPELRARLSMVVISREDRLGWTPGAGEHGCDNTTTCHDEGRGHHTAGKHPFRITPETPETSVVTRGGTCAA